MSFVVCSSNYVEPCQRNRGRIQLQLKYWCRCTWTWYIPELSIPYCYVSYRVCWRNESNAERTRPLSRSGPYIITGIIVLSHQVSEGYLNGVSRGQSLTCGRELVDTVYENSLKNRKEQVKIHIDTVWKLHLTGFEYWSNLLEHLFSFEYHTGVRHHFDMIDILIQTISKSSLKTLKG